MTCDELLRRLTEFAEGALPPNLCEEVRSHLQDCSPCSELDRDLSDLARLCRECDPPTLPAALRRRLEERIRAWTERG
jgi:anti-sigma factor (TIGR02949 family)